MEKENLIQTLKAAQEMADKQKETEDGGSSNFDSPVIGWKTKQEKQIIEDALKETKHDYREWRMA